MLLGLFVKRKKLHSNNLLDIVDGILDINKLEDECYGGIKEDDHKEKTMSAYLLFYELSKKKPIKIILKDSEIENYKEKYGEIFKNNLEEIERKFDISLDSFARDFELLSEKYEDYPDIIWFPQGIFLITEFKTNS